LALIFHYKIFFFNQLSLQPYSSIIAPITQIFDVTLNVTGSWEINRSYPQWFGAIAATSQSAAVDCAAAINKAILMKSTGEVFMPRGVYRVDSTIRVRAGIVLRGDPGRFS